MESINVLASLPLIGTLEKQNLNKFCDYHGDRGNNANDCYHLKKQIEEAVASGKLAHLVKDLRRVIKETEVKDEGIDECLETASQFLATPSELTSDGVKSYVTASESSHLKETLRRFVEATTSRFW
ncbi:hypothetical protein Tco_1300730 [Tanacetum coccineum]